MEKRTWIAVALLVAVGAAVAVAKTRKNPHARDLGKPGGAAAGAPAALDTSAVDELDIVDAQKPAVTLKKQGDAWRVTAPVDDAADQAAIDQALKTLSEVTWKTVIAESADSHDKLQVKDDQVVKVAAKKAGQPLLTLWIGKTGKVRVNGEARVWDVGKLNRFAFIKDTKLWRKRELLRLEKKDVTRIEIVTQAPGTAGKPPVTQTLAITHAQEQPPAPTLPANPGAPPPPPPPAKDTFAIAAGAELVGGGLDENLANQVLSSLARLDIADFADDAKPESTGLAAPRAVITVIKADGSRQAVELGDEKDGLVYARIAGTPRIFKLQKGVADNFARRPAEWRDKTIVSIEGKDVARVSVDVAGDKPEKLVFERDGDTWKATTPKDLPDFEPNKAQGLAAGFAHLRAAGIAQLSPEDAKAAFAKPQGSITIARKDGSSITLVVGAQAKGADQQVYVQVKGKPEIFLVAEYNAKRWLAGAADYKKAGPPPPHAELQE
jgi:hypothetical protein